MVVGLRPVVACLLLTVLASTPAAAAPPPDAFCVILYDVQPGMQGVRVLVDEETTPEERSALFPSVDTNGDGNITRSEGETWRRANLRLHNGTVDLPPVHALTMRPMDTDGDGGPLYVAVTRQVGHTFHKQTHTQPWPVTASIDLETQAVREFSYPLIDGAQRFELHGGSATTPPATSTTTTTTSSTTTTTSQGQVTPEYVVVRAPEGWLVERVQGRDYAGPIDVWSSTRELDLPAFDTKSPFTFTFVRAASGASATSSTGPVPSTTPTGTATPSGGKNDSFTIPATAVVPLMALALGALAVRRRLGRL